VCCDACVRLVDDCVNSEEDCPKAILERQMNGNCRSTHDRHNSIECLTSNDYHSNTDIHHQRDSRHVTQNAETKTRRT